MDWQSAFETCPPYGNGPGPYTYTDTIVLSSTAQCLEALRSHLTQDGIALLEQYLKFRQEYLHRCCRYYYSCIDSCPCDIFFCHRCKKHGYCRHHDNIGSKRAPLYRNIECYILFTFFDCTNQPFINHHKCKFPFFFCSELLLVYTNKYII